MKKRTAQTIRSILSLVAGKTEVIVVHDTGTHLIEGVPVILRDHHRGRIIITSEFDKPQVKKEYGIE